MTRPLIKLIKNGIMGEDVQSYGASDQDCLLSNREWKDWTEISHDTKEPRETVILTNINIQQEVNG